MLELGEQAASRKTAVIGQNPAKLTRAVQGILNFDARANYKTPADFTCSMRELADIPRLFVVWQVLASTGR